MVLSKYPENSLFLPGFLSESHVVILSLGKHCAVVRTWWLWQAEDVAVIHQTAPTSHYVTLDKSLN